MDDLTAFEARLTDAYARYAAAMPTAVDPRLVAEAAAAPQPIRRRSGRDVPTSAGVRSPRTLLIVAALVSLSLLLLSSFVGSRLTPGPSAGPSRSAGASAATGDPATRTAVAGSGAVPPGLLTAGPDMAIGRLDPAVVVLADGRVLIAAGQDATEALPQVPVELLDPMSMRMTTLVADGPRGGSGSSGVLLPDGRVFVLTHDGNSTSSLAYLVDPATSTSERIAVKKPANAPPFGVDPTLALLHDGRVLIAGGLADVYGSTLLATAVLFDPTTRTLTPTGPMLSPRWQHAMTTLTDGRVIVAGGEGRADVSEPSGDPIPPDHLGSAEVYDPVSGTFSRTGAMTDVRGETLAVPLADGRVAVLPRRARFSLLQEALGQPGPYDGAPSVPIEVYDPATGAFAPGGKTDHVATSATLLPGDRILLAGVAGDVTSSDPAVLGWASLYDPATGRSGPTIAPRAWFAKPVAIPVGGALFVGGVVPNQGGWPGDLVHWIETEVPSRDP